jgi:hypothetical protein
MDSQRFIQKYRGSMKTKRNYLISCCFLSGVYANAETIEKNSDMSVTITVKNEFKKRMRQILTKEMKSHPVKICRAKDRKVCTETVMIENGKSHEFTLRADDPKFEMDFESNGYLKPESIEVYTNDVVCGHEDDADKQFYPSKKIPYDTNNVQVHPHSMEVKIHRMVGHVYWTHAYCSILYRDQKGRSNFAIVNFSEVMDFCRASEDKEPNRMGLYPYSGFLPPKHALAKGLWNDDMSDFSIEKVRYKGNLHAKNEFCEDIKKELLLAEIAVLKERYEELEKRFLSIKDYLDMHHRWNTVGIVFSESYLEALNKSLQNFRISDNPEQLAKLPDNFKTLSAKEQKMILDEYLSKGQELVDKMASIQNEIIFEEALAATGKLFDLFGDDSK